MPTTEQVTGILSQISNALSGFTLDRVLHLVILILVCCIVKKMIVRIVNKAILKLDVEKSLHTFIKSMVNIVLWVLIVLIIADFMGIPVTSLLALLSVAGLAVSLALQGILTNLAGGMTVLHTKPFVVGDFVEAGGVSGTVADIGMVYTRITTADNKVIFVPNSEISSEKIINYTNQTRRRVDIIVSAAYEADVSKVEEVLLGIVFANEKVFRDPTPFARVSNYGSSAIEYTIRAWCATDDYWDVYYETLKEIKVRFDEEGIEMTYDHLNVHIKKED